MITLAWVRIQTKWGPFSGKNKRLHYINDLADKFILKNPWIKQAQAAERTFCRRRAQGFVYFPARNLAQRWTAQKVQLQNGLRQKVTINDNSLLVLTNKIKGLHMFIKAKIHHKWCNMIPFLCCSIKHFH